ncbi:DUF4062 domain-containing protein [Mesorhizobium sp. M0074]|uniref:DUF4062 domain-containing protein n=1 Tax=unclassified Mesorhizobium TaxID=325217 RepID=UPI003337619C
MDVKYQIFVSSTYADLVDERRSVIEAVLNPRAYSCGDGGIPSQRRHSLSSRPVRTKRSRLRCRT